MRALPMILAVWLAFLSGQDAQAQVVENRGQATVAVLAHRGTEDFHTTWAPLQRFLESRVPGWSFSFVPVTLVSARGFLENGEIDFLVTNPGHYVTLNASFPMSVLSTRSRRLADGESVSEFGSVIFSTDGSEVLTLNDAAGRSVVAVDADAFGGFQMAWREFRKAGIDPFSDFSRLEFVGFPQDQIVDRVLSGNADIGVVRSGLLEAMASETGLDLGRLRVLNANADFTHPERVSTRLYPEWPFLAMASTDPALRDGVALALLSTQGLTDTELGGMQHRWAAPVSYHAAEELVAEYETRGAAASGFTGRRAAEVVVVVVMLSFGVMAVFLFLRRRRPEARSEPTSAAETPQPQTQEPDEGLTPREREILHLITEGNSTKEIAKALRISPKTVEFHRSNLLKKYDAKSSLQLVKLAGSAQT